MRTAWRALMGFRESGAAATICVQGTTLRLEKVLGLSEDTVTCEMGGSPWVFDLGFVSGICTAERPPMEEEGKEVRGKVEEPAPLKAFLSGEAPLGDVELLSSQVQNLVLPDFVQSESLWSFLKEEFHQNPACLSDVDKILDLMEEVEADPENVSLRDKLVQTITSTAQAFPQSSALFDCLRARTFCLFGDCLSAARLLYDIGRLPESLSLVGKLLTPETLAVGKLLFGYVFIQSFGRPLTCFEQKLVLFYAKLCEEREDVGVLVSLLKEVSSSQEPYFVRDPAGERIQNRHLDRVSPVKSSFSEEVDASYLAAALYLIRRKNPSYTYGPQKGAAQLRSALEEAWEISRGTSFEEYLAVRKDGMNRFQGVLTGSCCRNYEELEGRSFYQSDVDARFGSYAGYYQYWLEFQNGPMGKNSMYLNPHQIIDPLLAKCLARLPLSQAQRLGVIFVAGENSTRVAATCAFLAPGSRRTALDCLEATISSNQRNHLAFYLEFYNLQKTDEASMLRVFDRESLLSHRLSSPERAQSDAQTYLFLHSVLREVPQERTLPAAWGNRGQVARCARALLAEKELDLRHLWLGRLIDALAKEGPLGQDLLVKGYCHGLPEEDPFYYPLWGGRSKEAIFSDCLQQMGEFRFLEALEGFAEWEPKMLQKHRAESPDKLKNASHRSQYALCEALRQYCQAVLSQDGEPMERLKDQILSERGLTRSMKEKLLSVFQRLSVAEGDYGFGHL